MPQNQNTSHQLTEESEAAKELAAVYARVSSVGQLGRDGDEDGDGYSLPAQVEACKREAISRGAEMAKVYLERAESARSDDRPVLKQMLRELPTLGVKYLIVHKVDRLARNRLDDAVLYQKIVGMGITLVSATENIDDTAAGRLMHGMLAAFNEYYSHNLSNEVKKGLTRKHELGGTPFKPPIGYQSAQRQAGAQGIRGVVLDPKRAPLVELAFQLYLTAEWSLRDLAGHMAEQGLRSRGTPKYPERILGPNRIHEMLQNPYYMGIVKWGGRSYPGRHPKLIDAESFERIQVLLAAARVSGERPQIHHHYLRGTVMCDQCSGRLLFGRHRSRSGEHYDYFSCTNRTVRQRRIRCDASGHYSVPHVADNVEQVYRTVRLSDEVMEQIRTEVREELAGRAGLVEREAERHERALKQIEAKQEKLVQLYYDDLVTVDVFEREQAKLKAETKAARRLRRVAIVQSENVEQTLKEALERLEDIQQMYLDGTPLERRVLNRAIFKRIEIGEDGKITGTVLTPVYQALSAWQPTFGQPPAPREIPAKTDSRSVLVRPSSDGADKSHRLRNPEDPRTGANSRKNAGDRGGDVRGGWGMFAGIGTAEGPQDGRCGPFCGPFGPRGPSPGSMGSTALLCRCTIYAPGLCAGALALRLQCSSACSLASSASSLASSAFCTWCSSAFSSGPLRVPAEQQASGQSLSTSSVPCWFSHRRRSRPQGTPRRPVPMWSGRRSRV